MRSFIIFCIDVNAYAIDIESVKRILPYQDLTAMPDESEHIEGMFHYEDKIIKTLSFRKMIGLEPFKKDKNNQRCLIIIPKDNDAFSILIDAVDEIVHIEEENLHITSSKQSIAGFMNVEAMLEHNGKLVTVIKDINIGDK